MAIKRQLVKRVWHDIQMDLAARGGTWLPKRKLILGIPDPIPGEVFSSWMHRSAYSSRLSLKQLKAIWAVKSTLFQIDCGVAPLESEIIASTVNHLAAHTIEETRWSPQSYLAKWRGLCLTTDPLLHSPIYRYCPECLRDDAIPFFRKAWRLAFNYVCTEHAILLRDTCPGCLMGIDLDKERDPRGLVRPSGILRFCPNCGADLCDVGYEGMKSPFYEILVEAQFKLQVLVFDSGGSDERSARDQYFGPPWEPEFIDHLGWQYAQCLHKKKSFLSLDHVTAKVHFPGPKLWYVVPAGINGTRLFHENAQAVQKLFARHKIFSNTYWVAEGKMETSSLQSIIAAIAWLDHCTSSRKLRGGK